MQHAKANTIASHENRFAFWHTYSGDVPCYCIGLAGAIPLDPTPGKLCHLRENALIICIFQRQLNLFPCRFSLSVERSCK
jgi:hypothetical protein